jgi:acetolactate synthase-1/2/3 large subunit
MNIQELQTLVGYSLPVKIIILNNYGYVSIKQTQQNYFSDNVFGTCPNDGVTMPEFTKVGEAFGIESYKVFSMEQWHSDKVQNALTNNSPVLIEIICDPSQIFQPKLAAKKLTDGSLLAPSLENMSPFLSDEEMISNKI